MGNECTTKQTEKDREKAREEERRKEVTKQVNGIQILKNVVADFVGFRRDSFVYLDHYGVLVEAKKTIIHIWNESHPNMTQRAAQNYINKLSWRAKKYGVNRTAGRKRGAKISGRKNQISERIAEARAFQREITSKLKALNKFNEAKYETQYKNRTPTEFTQIINQSPTEEKYEFIDELIPSKIALPTTRTSTTTNCTTLKLVDIKYFDTKKKQFIHPFSDNKPPQPVNFSDFPSDYLANIGSKIHWQTCGDSNCTITTKLNHHPCRNPDCVTKCQCHDECFDSLRNGQIKTCHPCTITLHITSHQFSPTEFFEPVFDPNLDYKPFIYFEDGQNTDNTLNHNTNSHQNSKQIDTLKYCLLKSTKDLIIRYYLLVFRSMSDLSDSARRLISAKFNSVTNNFLFKSRLKDKEYKYEYDCPIDNKHKTISLQIKVNQLTGHSINMPIIRDLLPIKLQRMGTNVGIKELGDLEWKTVQRELHKDKHALLPVWLTKGGDSKMLFSHSHYKLNEMRMKCQKRSVGKGLTNRFVVYDGIPDIIGDKYPEYDDSMEYWIDCVVNPLIQTVAVDVPEMNHWKDISFRFDRMKEILYYHRNNGRHCDGTTAGLFNLQLKIPDDGAALIATNVVNALMDKNDGSHGLKDGSVCKEFCATTLPESLHTCSNERKFHPYYHHISNIRQGDVILMAFDAVRFRPHKPEECNHGKTVVTMCRNKYPSELVDLMDPNNKTTQKGKTSTKRKQKKIQPQKAKRQRTK